MPSKPALFTFEEKRRTNDLGSTFTEIVETKLTKRELDRKQAITAARKRVEKEQATVKAHEKACEREGHRVRHDKRAGSYDERFCFICGAALGLI